VLKINKARKFMVGECFSFIVILRVLLMLLLFAPHLEKAHALTPAISHQQIAATGRVITASVWSAVASLSASDTAPSVERKSGGSSEKRSIPGKNDAIEKTYLLQKYQKISSAHKIGFEGHEYKTLAS
jgi:hypothetical protein